MTTTDGGEREEIRESRWKLMECVITRLLVLSFNCYQHPMSSQMLDVVPVRISDSDRSGEQSGEKSAIHVIQMVRITILCDFWSIISISWVRLACVRFMSFTLACATILPHGGLGKHCITKGGDDEDELKLGLTFRDPSSSRDRNMTVNFIFYVEKK